MVILSIQRTYDTELERKNPFFPRINNFYAIFTINKIVILAKVFFRPPENGTAAEKSDWLFTAMRTSNNSYPVFPSFQQPLEMKIIGVII